MQDPFPKEQNDADVPNLEQVDDLVYPPNSYIEDYVPQFVYIPSDKMMFKIMRACIGLTNPEDLWYKIKM